MITCKKQYTDIPFAHRQHNHAGHCSFIHGHNWGFEFEFYATFNGRVIKDGFELAEHSANGFVVDFGDLKWLKDWLNKQFDHALVLNDADPYLDYFRTVLVQNPNAWKRETDKSGEPCPLHGPFARLCIVPNCGAEGLAEYVFNYVNRELYTHNQQNVYLARVTVSEDSKNSATYYNPATLGGCNHE